MLTGGKRKPCGPGTSDDLTNEVVHPSLIYEPNGWNGYKFWLAYTPYPGGNSIYENPCIAVSNDFETWVTPNGLTNPIVGSPAGATEYNADVHIALSPDKTTIYMMYRERGVDNKNNLFLLHSTDGITWSTPVIIKTGEINTQDFASPSFWFNGTNWVCLYHDLDAENDPVEKIETIDGDIYGTWSSPSTVTMTHPDSGSWWHSFFIKLDDDRILGLVQDDNSSGGELYWAISGDDGDTFDVLMAENQKYYRSAFAITEKSNDMGLYVIAGRISEKYFYASKGLIDLKDRADDGLQLRTALAQAATLGISGPLLADLFSRADSTSTLGSDLTGKTYSNTSAPNLIGISSGRAYNVDTGNCRALIDLLNVTDFNVSLKFTDIGSQAWLIFRGSDTSNYWRIGSSTAGNNCLVVQQLVAGAYGAVNEAIYGYFVDGDRVRVECKGRQIKIYLNDLLIKTYNSSVHLTGDQVGIQASGETPSYFNEFFVW